MVHCIDDDRTVRGTAWYTAGVDMTTHMARYMEHTSLHTIGHHTCCARTCFHKP